MSDCSTSLASRSMSPDMASSMTPTPSFESAFLNKLPRELRNNVYSRLIPAKLEVEVYSKRPLNVTLKLDYPIESVNLEDWQQLTSTRLVCKQLRTELDEEIAVAKKTKACTLCLHMKDSAPASWNADQQQHSERFLDGFSKIIVTMPFAIVDLSVDYWVGRFTYVKGRNGVWSLDAGGGYLLEGESHYTEHKAKLLMVKNKVIQNITEDGERGMAQVIEAMKAGFEWKTVVYPAEYMVLFSSTVGIKLVIEWLKDHSDWSGMQLITL